ncbi:Cortical actin cytoskeleton protein [Komagataella phaffii CBS 7435]|uniref:Component of yeast cortical actin cytoskeleton n=2 Tax=Komagataella phaffii TaxID=460519 RepID=C4R501_KOMPG|nr:uncharacterized protein PAS_chr3_0589 [Komagataella phaffii GS115]AOA64200.1 GQ67_03665T0 [Komagataella phaffii]CAH2449595.1 Cortical actin cytoskeleton protein [Komagataella phaffii CBS 7435]AOA69366.1 GQ68_03637T0 [Komagataella phaffii GS115]CAY70637.1 Component of yeast cortical actin cytoskeleton [Komagataella phaffii GS115]CCA39574.1 Cortical actin cytoskeleton protein [Komagataella phaffii CBS 7435]
MSFRQELYSDLPKDVPSLDDDLQSSRLARYNNPKLISDIKKWLFGQMLRPSGKSIPDEEFIDKTDLIELLRDGVYLCQLIDVIDPGKIKYKASKMPFVQMENIANFLQYAREVIGVPENELFQTVDLYEGKDPYQVAMTIQALSRQLTIKDKERFPNSIGPELVEKRKPPVPTKPTHLAGWSKHEYGYINKDVENVVFSGKRDITGRR